MTTRRHIIALIALAPMFAVPVKAGEIEPFSAPSFEAAQRAGRPILVAVSAPWCPICRAQKPILAKLAAEPRFKDLVIYGIDFDSQKELLRRFDARMQSTLIAFKGTTETGRSVGETQPEWIEGLLDKTL